MSTKTLRIVAVLLALGGLALVLASSGLGEAAGQAILARHGGSMDTGRYLSEVAGVTSRYRLIGAICLGVGLFRSLER